ncbi:MAG: endonuclease domain-containing protein [Bdellovibrionales bacterium]
MNCGSFVFQSYAFDESSGLLRLHYRFSGASEFEEIIQFPLLERVLSPIEREALDRAFRLLFLLAGVSYYKALAPEFLRCDAFELDPQTASFVEEVYARGLAEFAYRNGLDMRSRAKFDRALLVARAPRALAWDQPHRLGVPIGGGKDSLLSLELLKQAGEPLTLFAVGSLSAGVAAPIQAALDRADAQSAVALRQLSPRLQELNAHGALNGHVPITAIVSAIALATAILQGWNAIVMSNERSANIGNIDHDGIDVNHQYSKSFAFEDAFATYVNSYVTKSISYFSLLRPLSEASIAARFAKLSHWHDCFRSCNTAFRQEQARRSKFWCCSCPKCRFVFLALAPFLSRNKLVRIFGRDLLDDLAQTLGYEDLCGLRSHKPFECVGEIQECAALMHRLSTLPAWRDALVVQDLSQRLVAPLEGFDQAWAKQMAPDYALPHRVPDAYRELLEFSGIT